MVLNRGEVLEFDNQGVNPHLEVFRVTAQKHLGLIEEAWSTPANSRPFVVAINGAYESAGKIVPVPRELVREFETEYGEYKTVLEGIDEIIDEAFEKRALFSDLGIKWAIPSAEVNVEAYKAFNPFSLNNSRERIV